MLSDRRRPVYGKRILKNILIFVITMMLMGLTGCNTLEDGVEKAKPFIPKGYNVVQIEQVSDNSGIVFYTYQEGLSAGIFTKNRFGWDWVGSSVGKLVTYPDGLQWRYADLGDKGKTQYSVFYGKVLNKDISKIEVTTTNGKKTAGKIVDTEELRLWYAFVNESQVPSVNADIIGYSQEGKMIYSFSQPKEK